jgi:sigma-B regulation protein RsbU (phosphoserine phosphatase)
VGFPVPQPYPSVATSWAVIPGGLAQRASMRSAKYWDVAMRLDPGDKVLLFTDGITEATNPRGEEYGENRLRQRLDIDEPDTATMHREIMQEVSDFCLGNLADDATLGLISFLPSAKASL